MSADIENFRQAVQRFDELIVELERTDDKLSSNFERYITLSDTLGDSVHNQRGIIEAIDNLMIKGTNILNDINTLNNNTKTINKNTIDNIKKEFEEFDYHIQKTMSSVVNSIDLSTFRRQVESLFNNKISELESEVIKLSKLNDVLSTLNDNLDKSIKTAKTKVKETFDYTKENIDDSLERFNSMAKVVNWKVILSVGFGGMFLGALIMGGWGLQFFKDKIFKDEQIALQEWQSVTNNIKAGGLEKFVAENKIDIGFGYFSDTKEPYIYLAPNSYAKSWTNEKNNYYIIKTKEYK